MEDIRDRLVASAFINNDDGIDWSQFDDKIINKKTKDDLNSGITHDYSKQVWNIANWITNNESFKQNEIATDDDNDDKEFQSLVGTSSSLPFKSTKSSTSKLRFPKYNKFSTNYNSKNRTQPTNSTNQSKRGTTVPYKNKAMNYNRCQYKWFLRPSIQLKETWTEIETFDFSKISKIKNEQIPHVEDVIWCGKLHRYNTTFDHIRKTPASLKAKESTQFSVAASEDPLIRSNFNMANVFATDVVLSTLMTCVKSLASWHIAIVKIDDYIFIDKRHESGVDLSFVCENARDPPFDTDINSPLELALEATRTRQKYLTQCTIQTNPLTMENPDPFINSIISDEDNTQLSSSQSSVAYRYRLFTLPDGVKMLVRCYHDAYLCDSSNNDSDVLPHTEYIDIYTLLQWSSKLYRMDWRNKFFEQSGSILASEIKLNNNKVARWTAKAILSGTDQIKIGFISRDDLRTNKSHCIVGSTTCRPSNLAKMIDFSYGDAWGIVYYILDYVKSLSDGTFILLKVPLKNSLRLYRTPDSNLPSEDDEVDVDVDDNFPLADAYDYDDILFE